MTDRLIEPVLCDLLALPAPRPSPDGGRGARPAGAGLAVVVHHGATDSVACVHGDLDIATAPRFLAAFADLFAGCPRDAGAAGRTLRCDLSGLGFVSAAGVTALEEVHRAAREQGMTLRLVSCSRPARRVLALVGSPLLSHTDAIAGRARC